MLTLDQVRSREKDVTRRLGWLKLQVGDVVQPVEKCMGIPKGCSVVRIGGPIGIRKVHREPLRRLLDDPEYGSVECAREGFPSMSPAEFVQFFCETHRGATPDTDVTRIEFFYLPRQLDLLRDQ